MIGTSLWNLIFIRFCIVFLHYVAPFSLLYCLLSILMRPLIYRIPQPFEAWIIAEALFFILIYLPRYYILQNAAIHPPTKSRENRRKLFQLCNQSLEDPEHYLSMWFKDAVSSEIRRENVKEFFSWAFLNKPNFGVLDEEELEEYTDQMEILLGRKFQPGKGDASSLRPTADKVKMLHRSLLWYLCVFVVDTITYVYMLHHSFQFHRLAIRRFPTIFPFRPVSLLATHMTPAKTLTYWHRPHTSKEHLPVLFIHGIGIGLYPYVNFLAQLNHISRSTGQDGDIGVIAIEIMPISFRITHAALDQTQMCDEIHRILLKHEWAKVTLVSHSYGSVIATHLLRNTATSNLTGPVLFIDPVSFLLHLPDVAYNFTYRKPSRANEHQLYYFASMDMGVAHTLSRRFFWSENILWRHELKNRPVTVVLSGKDLIVNTKSVARYLARNDSDFPGEEDWKHQRWVGQGLDIIWLDGLDHAQVFDSKQNCRMLVDVVRAYSTHEYRNGPMQDTSETTRT